MANRAHFKKQGNIAEAIAAFERGITVLEEIRSDILIAARDLQFDFRDRVEPLYRQLAQLRLELASQPSVNPQERTQELNDALSVIDRLKLAELQNYFGDDCAVTAEDGERMTTANNSATAVFNSIILEDRTAIIVSFPDKHQEIAWINQDSESLRQNINQFRLGLESFFDTYDLKPAQAVYNWFIRPFAEDLERAQIKTLIFVQDGILRSIPMAALHDGKKFLIQKYAIATTPSLSLTDTTPQTVKQCGRWL